MSFSSSHYLRKATSRAKSDVANKLVSMFLHDLSRRICSTLDLSVTDLKYTASVAVAFGELCPYCRRPLEKDRVAVEHLEAMNRFRVGLHIPGNVVVSCKPCNGEKRRDDSQPLLTLADTGWESFLSHDFSRCPPACKTCHYWQSLFPDRSLHVEHLCIVRQQIRDFCAAFPEALSWSSKGKTMLAPKLNSIYKNCQNFAIESIKEGVVEFFTAHHER